jgi:hypothetical protein
MRLSKPFSYSKARKRKDSRKSADGGRDQPSLMLRLASPAPTFQTAIDCRRILFSRDLLIMNSQSQTHFWYQRNFNYFNEAGTCLPDCGKNS